MCRQGVRTTEFAPFATPSAASPRRRAPYESPPSPRAPARVSPRLLLIPPSWSSSMSTANRACELALTPGCKTPQAAPSSPARPRGGRRRSVSGFAAEASARRVRSVVHVPGRPAKSSRHVFPQRRVAGRRVSLPSPPSRDWKRLAFPSRGRVRWRAARASRCFRQAFCKFRHPGESAWSDPRNPPLSITSTRAAYFRAAVARCRTRA